jgi:hypothetical protein
VGTAAGLIVTPAHPGVAGARVAASALDERTVLITAVATDALTLRRALDAALGDGAGVPAADPPAHAAERVIIA